VQEWEEASGRRDLRRDQKTEGQRTKAALGDRKRSDSRLPLSSPPPPPPCPYNPPRNIRVNAEAPLNPDASESPPPLPTRACRRSSSEESRSGRQVARRQIQIAAFSRACVPHVSGYHTRAHARYVLPDICRSVRLFLSVAEELFLSAAYSRATRSRRGGEGGEGREGREGKGRTARFP